MGRDWWSHIPSSPVRTAAPLPPHLPKAASHAGSGCDPPPGTQVPGRSGDTRGMRAVPLCAGQGVRECADMRPAWAPVCVCVHACFLECPSVRCLCPCVCVMRAPACGSVPGCTSVWGRVPSRHPTLQCLGSPCTSGLRAGFGGRRGRCSRGATSLRVMLSPWAAPLRPPPRCCAGTSPGKAAGGGAQPGVPRARDTSVSRPRALGAPPPFPVSIYPPFWWRNILKGEKRKH